MKIVHHKQTMRSLFGSQLLLLSAALGLLGDLALAQNDTASDGTQDALADPVPVTVETPLGQVIGVQIGGVDNFLGIQYAVSFFGLGDFQGVHYYNIIAALARECRKLESVLERVQW